ncbi:STAS domain-containing protein [Nonomuraea sp. NPDC050663]|uniref:STAS domain-containing protein n=1 Tax=Nonomuraea sp. NPDC050663 TaxID=3364370 RepID=UPI00379AACF9
MTSLTLTIDERADSTVIRVCGEVDATNHARLAAALNEARRLGAPIVMDLSAMTFLDSSGLNVLLRAYNQSAHDGLHLRLAALHPRPHRLLEIAGLLPHLRTCTTVGQALAEISAHRPKPLTTPSPAPPR